MITTKNNFKGYLRKHYPDISAYPVYGQPIYILDKRLSDIDNYNYNVQQLPNGKYVAFIGVSISEAMNLLADLRNNGIPKNSHVVEKKTAPTTFSCFEAWLERHNVEPLHRTFCNNMTPEECFHSEHIEGCSVPQQKGVWYMYELPSYIDNGERFANIPHVNVDYGDQGKIIVVLIKASASRYKSKKQRFLEKFQFMQPIYEKLIAACAVAQNLEQQDNPEAKEAWFDAANLCNQYMSAQFEIEATVDVNEMKEAYRNGTIGLFTRNPDVLHHEDNEETF